jgi:hypothetical protein
MAAQLGNVPEPISLSDARALIQDRLREARLLSEQIAAVKNIDASSLGPSLAPDNIIQEALEVNLKKLNLRQVVEIGHSLQGVHESIKLAGLDVVATAEDDHYFDVNMRLIKFALPMEEKAEEPEAEAPRGRRGRQND